MSSRLVSLPYEILQEIVLQVVLPEDGRGGPPSGLIPILLTCRALNRRLSHNTNPHLYHSIACAQFDLDAARRRSSSSKRPLVLTASVLSHHLRHTWLALHRLRRADVDSPDLHDDLWDAFLLASENDGRNILHLRWANVHALTEQFLAHKMWRESETDDGGWPRDSPLAALAAWVFWATTDRRELESFDMDRRQATVQMILPFVLVSFKYPRFFAPDLAFDLPLPADVRPRLPPPSQPNAHGEYPVFRRPTVHSRVRFGRRITLAPPPLPSAASLVFFTVRSLIPVVVPSTIPVDRQAAIAAGVTGGQTQADLHELNASGLTQLFPVGGREPKDEDVLDPWAPMPKWKGSPYTPGTLNGLFCGRYLVPDVEGYMSLLSTPTYPEGFGEFAPFTSMWPVYMRLVEHHSISPALPVPSARNADDPVDCGVHNAWFPNTVHFLRSSAANVLHVDADGSRYEYETFVPGKANSHDPSTCGNCIARASASSSAPSKARSSYHPPGFDEEAEKMFEAEGFYDEDEDEDGDDVGDVFAQDGKCTGIQDIVITGETDPSHGAAWGHYVILGRVRRRDGLVVLLRVPKVPGRPRWVFRGLVHAGSTIVGAWRGAVNVHGQARAVPWEGAFAMTRRVEDVPSAGPSSVNSTASV